MIRSVGGSLAPTRQACCNKYQNSSKNSSPLSLQFRFNSHNFSELGGGVIWRKYHCGSLIPRRAYQSCHPSQIIGSMKEIDLRSENSEHQQCKYFCTDFNYSTYIKMFFTHQYFWFGGCIPSEQIPLLVSSWPVVY